MASRFKLPSECSVGITCFANACPGFTGILRHRFCDFIVNEIDPSGNVVHLTSMEAPPEQTKLPELDLDSARNKFFATDREAWLQQFRALAGAENENRLRMLFEQVVAGNDASATTLLASEDKSWRSQVHTFFKNKLPLFLTDTVDSSIRVRYNNGSLFDPRDGRRPRSDVSTRRIPEAFWPQHRKAFCQFHLFKENVSTQSAAMTISQRLGIKPKDMGFAGMKDKRAITTQRATVFKHSASKLSSLNKELRGIKLGNFSYVDKGLCLGELSGNSFDITIRGISAENDGAIRDAAEGLNKSGFINYYGLQRFGNCRVSTHHIGAKLLHGDWKGAVDLVLEPQEGEQPGIRDARNALKNAGPAEALKHMPHHMVAERSILIGLKKDPGNFLQAIFNIPAPMRAMYVHSYQSYMWNNAVSFRVQKYGLLDVVEGDLVLCQSASDELGLRLLEDDVEAEAVPDIDIHKRVQIVTREDVLSKKYTIGDVVLPLPGSCSVYPANAVADVYHDLARKDSLDLRCSLHRVKNFSIEHCLGTYRRILVKPSDFTWCLLRYDDRTLDIECRHDPTRHNVAKGSSLALQVKFALPPSVYATMAIRELMKMSTEIALHKAASMGECDDVLDTLGTS